MQLTYELTQKDFYESFIAHRNSKTLTKWFIRVFVSILLLLAAFGLVAMFVVHDSRTFSNFAPLYALVAVWLIVLWGAPWWSARIQFSKQPAAHGSRTVTLDESGVHWRWNGGSSAIEWRNFIKWVEAKNQFLLYSSPRCFNMIPKRGLSSAEITELRSMLSANVAGE